MYVQYLLTSFSHSTGTAVAHTPPPAEERLIDPLPESSLIGLPLINRMMPSNTNAPLFTQLKIAVIPAQSTTIHQAKLYKLASHLQDRLGVPVYLDIAETYDDAIALIVNEQVDLAYLGALSYIQAKAQNPQIEPLVAAISQGTGRPWSTSVILTSSQSHINSLADLQDKRFGFVSQSSTSGYLAPIAQFKTMDQMPNFSEVIYAGDHDSNVALLMAQKVDAIGINKSTFSALEHENEAFNGQCTILWESEPIPNEPIVAAGTLTEQQRIEIQKVLLDTPEGLVDVRGIAALGYTLVQDRDYDSIRNIQTILSKAK
ncbi:MAG: phosphate/phosphite/phosphonate ABC transporter substrate-binding protein [Chloroflexota bacterium]